MLVIRAPSDSTKFSSRFLNFRALYDMNFENRILYLKPYFSVNLKFLLTIHLGMLIAHILLLMELWQYEERMMSAQAIQGYLSRVFYTSFQRDQLAASSSAVDFLHSFRTPDLELKGHRSHWFPVSWAISKWRAAMVSFVGLLLGIAGLAMYFNGNPKMCCFNRTILANFLRGFELRVSLQGASNPRISPEIIFAVWSSFVWPVRRPGTVWVVHHSIMEENAAKMWICNYFEEL